MLSVGNYKYKILLGLFLWEISKVVCVCVHVWFNIYIFSCRAFIHVLKFSLHFFILKCKKHGRVSFSPVFVFLPESSLLQRRNHWCVFVTSLLIGMKQRVQVVFFFMCVPVWNTVEGIQHNMGNHTQRVKKALGFLSQHQLWLLHLFFLWLFLPVR